MRKIDALAFLLFAAMVFVLALVLPAGAEEEGPVPIDKDIMIVAEPIKAPQESEKIDAALDWHYLEDVTLTAYCPCFSCCGEYSLNRPNGIVYTASGAEAQAYHTIAVDSDVIPLGAWVEIDGHTYHAEDMGGGVNGNHIDVYFDSHDEAVAFGRQCANVRWYK